MPQLVYVHTEGFETSAATSDQKTGIKFINDILKIKLLLFLEIMFLMHK